MIQTKQLYEAPEAEALVVRFEGVICNSPNPGTQTELFENIDGGDL